MKLISLLLLFAGPALAQTSFVKTSPVANLTHQLDCVAQVGIRCSDKNFQLLWEKEFLASPADQKSVELWGALRKRYQKSWDLSEASGVESPADRNGFRLKLADKWRLAGLQSLTSEEYLTRLELVMAPNDFAQAKAVIQNFSPRFNRWWKNQAAGKARAFSSKMQGLMKRKDVRKLMAQMAAFYETESPLLYTYLYRPELTNEDLVHDRVERYALAEFLPGQDAKEDLDAIFLELARYHEADRTAEKRAEMATRLAPKSIPVLNVLPQTLAAAFSALSYRLVHTKREWEKKLSSPLSFSTDELVDQAAKSMLSLIEDWIRQKRTLQDPEFTSLAVERLSSIAALNRPSTYLKEMILVADASFDEKLLNQLRAQFMTQPERAISVNWTQAVGEILAQHPSRSVLIVMRPAQLSQLKSQSLLPELVLARLKAAVEDNKGVFAYTKAAPIFVLVGEADEQILESARKLRETPALFVDAL